MREFFVGVIALESCGRWRFLIREGGSETGEDEEVDIVAYDDGDQRQQSITWPRGINHFNRFPPPIAGRCISRQDGHEDNRMR